MLWRGRGRKRVVGSGCGMVIVPEKFSAEKSIMLTLLTPAYALFMSPNALMEQFLDYNVLYFDGQLPTDTIVKWSRSLAPDVVGDYDGDATIRLNHRLRKFRPVWKLTLLHEMAHLATHAEAEEHGPKWHKEMRRLYRIGAFEGLL